MRTPVNSALSAVDFLAAGDFVITSEFESQPTQAARAQNQTGPHCVHEAPRRTWDKARNVSNGTPVSSREQAKGFKRVLRDELMECPNERACGSRIWRCIQMYSLRSRKLSYSHRPGTMAPCAGKV